MSCQLCFVKTGLVTKFISLPTAWTGLFVQSKRRKKATRLKCKEHVQVRVTYDSDQGIREV